MSAGNGNDQCVSVDSNYVPWARQLLNVRVFVTFLVPSFLPGSDHSKHFSSVQVDLSNRMILRVTDIQEMLLLPEHMANSLWVVEARLCEGAIYQSQVPTPNNIKALVGFSRSDHKPVISCIGNH